MLNYISVLFVYFYKLVYILAFVLRLSSLFHWSVLILMYILHTFNYFYSVLCFTTWESRQAPTTSVFHISCINLSDELIWRISEFIPKIKIYYFKSHFIIRVLQKHLLYLPLTQGKGNIIKYLLSVFQVLAKHLHIQYSSLILSHSVKIGLIILIYT